ncbi:unnamed protein product, partial [Ectocarpus sp. 12 AP-2014]
MPRGPGSTSTPSSGTSYAMVSLAEPYGALPLAPSSTTAVELRATMRPRAAGSTTTNLATTKRTQRARQSCGLLRGVVTFTRHFFAHDPGMGRIRSAIRWGGGLVIVGRLDFGMQ